MKGKLMILGLILIAFISISAVSASENVTDDVLADDNDEYNAEIVNIEDYTAHYYSNDQGQFDLISYEGVYEDTRFDVVDNKTGKVIGAAYYLEDEDHGYCYVDAGVGSYKATLKIWEYKDNPYKVKPVTINVKITKAPVKLSAKKWVSTTKQYTTLKVTVKDEYNCPVEEGTVKFTINGKSYNVKVKKGVATKKIKLSKAKTYTYKATFSSKNYKTKTASSKVYVKKSKKTYTFKSGKYKVKIKNSKYVKLLDAKNKGKYKSFSFIVGKQYGRYPIHMYVFTNPKDAQYPKGDYVNVWIDDGRGMDGYHLTKKINLYTSNP